MINPFSLIKPLEFIINKPKTWAECNIIGDLSYVVYKTSTEKWFWLYYFNDHNTCSFNCDDLEHGIQEAQKHWNQTLLHFIEYSSLIK